MDWWLGLRHWNVCQIRGCDISGCFKHWVRHPESYHCCFISPFSGLYVHIILYRNLYPQYPQNFYFFIDLPPFKDPEPGRHASLLETGLNDEPEADWICWVSRVHQASNPPWVQRVQKKRHMIRRLVLSGEEQRIQQVTCLGKPASFLMVEKIARPIHVCWLP